MGVSSVDEAIDLFSYSARIISDLKRAIDLGQWDIHVVVRSFSPVPIEGELRGFVYKGKLRALSQYYAECYFSELVASRDAVAEKVRAFHRQVRSIDGYCDAPSSTDACDTETVTRQVAIQVVHIRCGGVRGWLH